MVLAPTNVLYVRGNAAFLEQNMDLPATDATTYAGRWIAVPSRSAAFATLALGLTLPSMLPRQAPSAPLELLAPMTIDGQRVEGIAGNFDAPEAKMGWSGRQVLYVTTASPHLPVALTQQGSANGGALTTSVRYSDYGQSVVVRAPADATAISSITTGP